MSTQLDSLVRELRDTLGPILVGIYLHGSRAMGDSNPARSDIDLLVVTRQGLSPEIRRRLAQVLLRRSGTPGPVEMSMLREADLRAWEHPARYDFHYSEDWREKYEVELATQRGDLWDEAMQRDRPRDPDLAGHVTVARERGVCLWGKPIEEVFPAVPRQHYVDSIVRDFYWGRERLGENPVYFILNACRILRHLREDGVWSKVEGARWALSALPEEHRALVQQALDAYQGTARFEEDAVARFAEYMEGQIGRRRWTGDRQRSERLAPSSIDRPPSASMSDPVLIADYDPRWPQMFEAEKARLLEGLGDRLVAIEHGGSTSVPGLGAKPVIDIFAALPSLDDAPACVEPLRKLGYEYVPEFEADIPERRYFRKFAGGRRAYQLHIYAAAGFRNRHELLFRDYLRAHPEAAREYEVVKRRLAAAYGTDREGYTLAKTEFIQGVLEKAGRHTTDDG